LSGCLAFRDSIRFALVAADAGIDVDAAIGRLSLRRGASDDGEGQQGEKHYSLHVPVLLFSYVAASLIWFNTLDESALPAAPVAAAMRCFKSVLAK
jgi:hypothetical protein